MMKTTQIQRLAIAGGFCLLLTATGRARQPAAGNGAVISIDTNRPVVEYSPLLFGQFIEHFHRQIYGGIYDPGSPLADEKGFRRDVIQALRELAVPVVRWPGGCYVSS